MSVPVGGGSDPQVNRFEQVSSDGHHLSLSSRAMAGARRGR